MWCGGSHLHKECPEKTNNVSIPACCNCKLADGEKLHPSNYRGSSYAKEEICKRKAQRIPKNTMGRVFSSNYTMKGLSFAAALQNKAKQQHQPHPHWVPVADPATVEKPSVPAPVWQQNAGQSVLAPDIKSLPMDNIFRVVPVIQQIMTEFNGAVSEEAK
jgi:hypothetical protein